MTEHSSKEIEGSFRRHGIDYSRPGFYDTPAFKAVEREHPAFLMSYAEYVDSLTFPEDYIARARQCVTEAAGFMFSELVRDGRRGACIDASGTLQRILDREGIWNYLVDGGVRVQFPNSSRIRDIHFWPLVHPDNPAKTGHAWLRVPPFRVVDITLPIQPYSTRVAQYFDSLVMAEEAVPYEPDAGDLFETELIEFLVAKHGRPPTMRNISPVMREFMKAFPAFAISYQQLRLMYIPMRISAIDGDLEEMRNLCLSGKYPVQLYEQFRDRKAKL